MRFILDLSGDIWEGWEHKYEFCVDNPDLEYDMDEIAVFMSVVVPWCIEQFGPSDVWTGAVYQGSGPQRWYHGGWQVFFVRDEDALAFRLRWC
jgi:hypothetical protein